LEDEEEDQGELQKSLAQHHEAQDSSYLPPFTKVPTIHVLANENKRKKKEVLLLDVKYNNVLHLDTVALILAVFITKTGS
jgi:hypothetical protein